MVRKRNWGVSNTFSESHRSSLPGNFCLFDIDGIHITENRNLIFYEEKYKMNTKDRGNFIDTLYDPKNIQGGFLINISHTCKVWIREESTDRWWYLKDGQLSKDENPGIDFIVTENLVYIQDIISERKHCLSAVILRTEGEKKSPYLPILDVIASTFSIPKVLVNDIHKKGSIYFKNDSGKILECLEGGNWINAWEDLGITRD
jgi:hypothetical protein